MGEILFCLVTENVLGTECNRLKEGRVISPVLFCVYRRFST